LESSAAHIDPLLLQQVADGDEAAFRSLFRVFVPPLQQVINRITKSHTITDDLVQETFLRVWVARDQLTSLTNPRSWILKIGFFLAINHVRRLKVHDKVIDVVGRQGSVVSSNTTEEDTDFRNMLRLVGEAVLQLPPRQREVYRLSREEGLTMPQIAERLSITPGTVKNQLVSALSSIRGQLEKQGYLGLLLTWWHFL
jgi:RNA polymerase sigma-70 factor (ECF subfamily)